MVVVVGGADIRARVHTHMHTDAWAYSHTYAQSHAHDTQSHAHDTFTHAHSHLTHTAHTQDLRAKIAAVLECVGFDFAAENLPAAERSALLMAQNYVHFRAGENWAQVRVGLVQYGWEGRDGGM